MLCLPELYYSAEILFRNCLCLTEFNWCLGHTQGHCGIHGKETDAFARAGSTSAFLRPCLPVTPSSVKGKELGDCLSSVENVTEKAKQRLNEIFTEAA
jgi:hypothetical protein